MLQYHLATACLNRAAECRAMAQVMYRHPRGAIWRKDWLHLGRCWVMRARVLRLIEARDAAKIAALPADFLDDL